MMRAIKARMPLKIVWGKYNIILINNRGLGPLGDQAIPHVVAVFGENIILY